MDACAAAACLRAMACCPRARASSSSRNGHLLTSPRHPSPPSLPLSCQPMSSTKKSVQVARPAGRYFRGKPGAQAAADSSDSEAESEPGHDEAVEARKAKAALAQGREMGVSLGSALGVDNQGRVVGIKKEGASPWSSGVASLQGRWGQPARSSAAVDAAGEAASCGCPRVNPCRARGTAG